MMQQLLLAGMREYGGTSQALWRFNIHNYNTNFGGKTGTSSNHSDAWYIGTTRNLVGGAWVGGEYRCIHFRTGELGQGSRTALPIFGYFMEKVLKDPDFKQYQGMFPKDPLEDIGEIIEEPYYEPADTDTIQAIPDTIQSFPIREEIISIDTIY
jgi:penicillin-binding protein 1A